MYTLFLSQTILSIVCFVFQREEFCESLEVLNLDSCVNAVSTRAVRRILRQCKSLETLSRMLILHGLMACDYMILLNNHAN